MNNEKQYFDNINGYYVKDSDARESLENIDTDISAQISTAKGEVLLEVAGTYATQTDLNTVDSKIDITATNILSEVSKTYATDTELSSAVSTINQRADGIESTVATKVGDNEVISKINQSSESVTINANKINLTSQDVINIMAANEMNLSSNHLTLEVGNDNSAAFYIFNKNGSAYDGICTIYPIGTTFSKSGSPLSSDYNYQEAILRDSTNNIYTSIEASGISTPTLTQTSKEDAKKNFERLDSGLEIIKNTDIYKYHLKTQDDTEKKHIGLVIGDNFKYSKEITSNDNESVDLYSMISVCFKAIQEQQKQIDELKQEIEDLKNK